MSNLKSKIILLSILTLVIVCILPMGLVFGATYSATSNNMNLSIMNGSNVIKNGDVITLSAGKSFDINVDSTSSHVEIGYYFGSGSNIVIVPEGQKTVKVTVPNLEAGSKTVVRVDAIINQEGLHEKVGPVDFYIQIPQLSVKTNGSEMSTTSVILMNVNQKVSILTKGAVKQIAYKWDNEASKSYATGVTEGVLFVPNYEAGSTHILQVATAYTDGSILNRVYNIKIAGGDSQEDPTNPGETTTITVDVKSGNYTLSASKTYYADPEEKLTVIATSDKDVSKITYSWDNGSTKTISGEKGTITVPEDYDDGKAHTLTVQAVAADGTKSAEKVYTIRVEEPEEYDDEDDELIIEPWMKENKDLTKLAVSLRNDSEDEDKANKNMYALNEEVIYYVDYKNGGKTTTKKISLVLNIPETFKVIKADGGTVSTKNGTITWTFNGLEEDEAGTKTVVVKYTKIGNSTKTTYKMITPLAEIKLENKVKDKSAVLNLIYKDSDTEINDTHYPYMYGDANATTFRPNDTITRAEGALVLTRIFGISTYYDKSTHDYPDLNETYLEARKAIIAATEYGIINGYEDGLYRPNQAMTRAEFMKIIATRISIENDDGFEIKDVESSIKLYKNPTRMYVINGEYTTEHWALEEVSLLTRLNMTPVSEKNKDLRLDEPITRAEVAQLVNFYLFRAPAETTTKTKTYFSDVNRSHKLFDDIVEATRAAHTYYITEEAKEIID